MAWAAKNKYKIAFILSLIIFFFAIVLLHSYYNLQSIIQPPSNEWGRSTSLGAADLYKKKPSVIANDNYAEILTANKSNFTHITVNRATREVRQEVINLKGVESYKVQKFEWDENNIYFIESNSLFFVTKNASGGYSEKIKIADEIKDFEIINSKNGIILAAAKIDGAAIYKEAGNGFQQYGESYKIDKISNIAGVQADNGVIHVAAYAETNYTDYPIYYLTFENGKWSLHGSIVEKSVVQSWSINDIDIGVDDTDAYIFYEMAKWDKNGPAAKMYNTVIPLSQEKIDMKFNRFYIFEQDAKDIFSFISEAQIIKTQENELKLTIIKNTYDKKYKNGFSGYYLTLDNGAITNTTRMTENQRLVIDSSNYYYNGDKMFVYLDAAGGFNYEAFYTETGKAYYQNAEQFTREDVSIAIMNTIPGYVSSVVVLLIKSLFYFPIVIWFLIVEFFEIQKFKENPRLTFIIGLVLHMLIKLGTLGSYYTEVSVSQMPPMLTFAGAKYFYAIGIAVIALLIEKLLRRHKPDIGIIVEYLVFALIDIEFTNLLLATYLL